jgi:ceramide glucosyltransferase
VNQLITLTREAKHEVIVLTDSNVRVKPNHLREIAAVLAKPEVGIATHLVAGAGEERIGALFDNLALTRFMGPMLAALWHLRLDEIVGKSMAVKRDVLTAAGGWQGVKDVLAEDQRLGLALRQLGLRSWFCPTPVVNFQKTQPFGSYWGRQSRWQMIRFRVTTLPAILEPLLNRTAFAAAGIIVAGASAASLILGGALIATTTLLIHISAALMRGQPFKLRHALLAPAEELTFLGIWIRGMTLGSVNWRGTQLSVIRHTRLAEREALIRARKLQKLFR